MTPDIATIASGLSEAQRAYLAAVAASTEPYAPRHGRTANWALRHGYVDQIVRINGTEGPAESFKGEPDWFLHVVEWLGQRFTPAGAQLWAYLQEQAK